jgi:hypothetical protein
MPCGVGFGLPADTARRAGGSGERARLAPPVSGTACCVKPGGCRRCRGCAPTATGFWIGSMPLPPSNAASRRTSLGVSPGWIIKKPHTRAVPHMRLPASAAGLEIGDHFGREPNGDGLLGGFGFRATGRARKRAQRGHFYVDQLMGVLVRRDAFADAGVFFLAVEEKGAAGFRCDGLDHHSGQAADMAGGRRNASAVPHHQSSHWRDWLSLW